MIKNNPNKKKRLCSNMINSPTQVNPYETDLFSDCILRAITMPRDERELRMKLLRKRENINDINYWISSFLSSVDCNSNPTTSIPKSMDPLRFVGFNVDNKTDRFYPDVMDPLRFVGFDVNNKTDRFYPDVMNPLRFVGFDVDDKTNRFGLDVILKFWGFSHVILL